MYVSERDTSLDGPLCLKHATQCRAGQNISLSISHKIMGPDVDSPSQRVDGAGCLGGTARLKASSYDTQKILR